MKKGLSFGLAILAMLLLFQGCYETHGDKVYVTEYDFPNGIWTDIFTLKPKGDNTTEIENGDYEMSGEIIRGNKAFEKRDAAQKYPKKLLIRFILETPEAYRSLAADKSAKKITLKLKVNTSTGEIPQQTVNIRDSMIIDPNKNESVRVRMKAKKGEIYEGDKLSLFYEQTDSSEAKTSAEEQ